MIFTRRTQGGPDPFLEGKVMIFLLGATLAMVGIARDSSLLVGLAIIVLLSGVTLRFLAGKASSRDSGRGTPHPGTSSSARR